MALLTVIRDNQQAVEIRAEQGVNLLEALTGSGIDLYSPCGGKGTCGKCRVRIREQGTVMACQFSIKEGIEIILPSRMEASILELQHQYTADYPVHPGDFTALSSSPFGVAIDIGTTTLVFYFYDFNRTSMVSIQSMLNPQTRYGADVITRINQCQERDDGLDLLHGELIRAINHQLQAFISQYRISAADIVKMTFTGNTSMLHFLLKVDPVPIARAPFTPGFTDEQIRMGADLDLNCNSKAIIKVLPSVSAYVGADIVAGLASIQPGRRIETYLFIDIGTNGELALVTPESTTCCSTAAGPAFEAANISCGMPAVRGAISEFTMDAYKTIGDDAPLGICGSGLLDIISELLKSAGISQSGELKQDFIIVPATDSASGKAIVLTPADVREFQLAKAAIAAGISILLKSAGMGPTGVDAVYLAGGFGNYLNRENAILTGLLKGEFRDKIIPVGNASGTGALIALKSEDFDHQIRALLGKMQYIELSSDPAFVSEYALNMSF